MFWFILGLILLVSIFFLQLVTITTTERVPGEGVRRVQQKPSKLLTVALPAFLGIILILLSFTAIVGPKQIGVVTTFGAISDRTLDPGLNTKLPWQKINELDGTKITLKFVGEKGCIGVRIGDNSIACASVVARYEIYEERADTLFADYRGVDEKSESIDGINAAISDALVRTELTTSLGSVFRDFDPLLSKDDKGEVQTVTGAPDLVGLSKRTQTALSDALVDVKVVSVKITFLRVSQQTQNNIEKLQDELAKTRQANQRIETATKEAEANNQLAASLNKNPNVLVSKCLDIVGEGKSSLPAGFNCFGSAGSVVIPSTK